MVQSPEHRCVCVYIYVNTYNIIYFLAYYVRVCVYIYTEIIYMLNLDLRVGAEAEITEPEAMKQVETPPRPRSSKTKNGPKPPWV